MSSRGYKWSQIEDLPPGWRDLQGKDLAALAEVWSEQRERLHNPQTLAQFNDRLQRQWAIETGIIERLYTIDRGITLLLIERGIDDSLIPHGATDKPAHEVVAIIRDQEHALQSLFDFVKQNRQLTAFYIKELHAILTQHQHEVEAMEPSGRLALIPLIKGDWKRHPNNPRRPDGSIVEYCPPIHVAAEMDRLIEIHGRHRDMGLSPEIEAAWLHHRFTQIHPFQDGNGRVARCLTTLVLLRAGWFPLVITREDRQRYLDACEEADFSNLEPLVKLFASRLKRQFMQANSLSEDVLRAAQLEEAIKAGAERLRHLEAAFGEKLRSVFETGRLLHTVAHDYTSRVVEQIRQEYGHDYANEVRVEHSPHLGGRDHWYKYQIVQTAKSLGNYWANTDHFRSWVRLAFRLRQKHTDIVISFHSLGRDFRGILVCSVFLFRRASSEEDRGDGGEIVEVIPACDDPFTFTYQEDPEEVRRRFSSWLERSFRIGIELWNQEL